MHHRGPDRSSPSVIQAASDVSRALTPQAAGLSGEIYRLILEQIPPLRDDRRVLALLEASVSENVVTLLDILQHGIDLENVRAPVAAEEYARRLAQRDVPITALLRAYRIGSARFQDHCLEELGRRADEAALVSAAGMRIADATAAYIDRISEELVAAFEAEKENWLRNVSAVRAARVRAAWPRSSVPESTSSARTWPGSCPGSCSPWPCRRCCWPGSLTWTWCRPAWPRWSSCWLRC